MKHKNIQLTLELSFTIHTGPESAKPSGDACPRTPAEPGGAQETSAEYPYGDAGSARSQVRRLVGCIVLAKATDWHSVWVEAYHRFFKRTGLHPVSESVRLGIPTHLDVVFAEPSRVTELFKVLDEMIREPLPSAA